MGVFCNNPLYARENFMRISSKTTLFVCGISAILFAVAATRPVFCDQGSKEKQPFAVGYIVMQKNSTPPVFDYSGSRGHHGNRILDSSVEYVMVWADGTIACKVAPNEKERWASYWYQTTIPVEKVEAAIQTITEDFEKYPVKNRPRESRIVNRIDASSSPLVRVYAPTNYEYLWVDHYWMKLYKENRETFQSGDRDLMLKKFKEMGDYRQYDRIVDYYRCVLPDAGLAKFGTPVDNDEEIFKCMEFYVADIEHLLLMEKTILDLLPLIEELEKSKHESDTFSHTNFIRIDCDTQDGKQEFRYTMMTEKEADEYRAERRKAYEQE